MNVFDHCRAVAYELLLSQPKAQLPICLTKLASSQNIYFDSLQSYCHIAHVPLESVLKHADLQDGCTICYQGVYLVLYNEWDNGEVRQRFTMAHELGHILLHHDTDVREKEAQANYFAAQLLAPEVLVAEVLQAYPSCTDRELAQIFQISLPVACYQRQRAENHFVEQDALDQSLLQFFVPELTKRMDMCREPIVSII